ncbi:DUF1919 domain-containing protein [Holdemania massiliensis]|uniref:DUF1919 domain-containing protein n=1 Tax=Holdemania massiliensis TaxID=1468449 RepID=UPI000684E593|nr:DUF1919 domain-containing protein [Holdemania massiliensis]
MEQTMIRRFTIDKMISMTEKIDNIFLSTKRRNKLNNTDFSIISNNCWGGSVYRRYGLQYKSPTIGLYFFAEEYIKFLMNLEISINSEIKIIDAYKSKYAQILEEKQQMNVPIGVINDDIEIVFLHYKTKQEAYNKWMRRAERLNFDNLIVKFSEMNLCNEIHLHEFEQLSFHKKILLTSKSYHNIQSGIIVEKYTHNGEISNDTLYYDSFLDLETFINSDVI